MDTVETTVRTAGALLAVLALIWIVTRLTRSRLGVATGPQVRVVQRVGLGRRSAVALIRVSDRSLLVGVGDNTVTLLAELVEPPSPAPLSDAPTAGPTSRPSPVASQRSGPSGVRGILVRAQDRTVRR